MPSAPIVIVGGGLAAGRAVVELREAGYDDEVVLFAEEPEVPYERPPLSKGYLQGEKSRESTYVQPPEWYAEHNVDLRLGEPVTSIDLEGHDRALRRGATPFGRLLLATGARPRRLDLASTDEIDVRYLRTLDGLHRAARAPRRRAPPPDPRRRLDRHGGRGDRAHARHPVTVVEPAELPLLAALGPDVAGRFAARPPRARRGPAH